MAETRSFAIFRPQPKGSPGLPQMLAVVRPLRARCPIFLTALLALTIPAIGEEAAGRPGNALRDSANPYLLQHAHNPVDWFPWGEEAIAKAKKENKPVFLSVGYSTCYWCHVAERTIYSNPEIAKLMNKWFVNIKVDREERPDIDETYMLARQLLSGSGGWPNNLFLTPDLKPFFAGSYFPPEDEGQVPGFTTVLREIHRAWAKDSKQIEAIGEQTHAALLQLRDTGVPERLQTLNHNGWLARARSEILPRQDLVSGGFSGGGPAKFPQPPLLHLLLDDYRLNGVAESLAAVAGTLDAIAFGGIHDHLAGGVHRYSTDPAWSVPHFEKMLYDNAQMLGVYADYYAIARRPLAREMAVSIVLYLSQRMTAPEGGFYTAEDAEVDGKEGVSYLWSRAEIAEALGGADAARFFSIYELTPLPEEPHGPGVLRVRRDRTAASGGPSKAEAIAGDTAPLRQKLLGVRDRRPQPLRDEKIVVAQNGLAISGLSRAGAAFGEPLWIALAKRAGDYLWREAFDEKTGKLRHHLYKGEARGEGFLDDYALLGLGFLDLGEASGEAVWRERAAALGQALMDRFVKPDGLVLTSTAGATLIVPPIDLQDGGDIPSGTSAAYALLARLGSGDSRAADAAMKILARMAVKIDAAPSAWPSFAASAALYAAPAGATAPDRRLDSAAHVEVTARGACDGGRDEIVVTIMIAPGYHVNANPASEEYLIPTKVSIPGVPGAKVIYPPGQTFKPKFLPEGIEVYEGATQIKIELPSGSLAASRISAVSVEVQACDAQICLPPSTIEAAVE